MCDKTATGDGRGNLVEFNRIMAGLPDTLPKVSEEWFPLFVSPLPRE